MALSDFDDVDFRIAEIDRLDSQIDRLIAPHDPELDLMG